MKTIPKNFNTDICVSNLVLSDHALNRTKITLVRCYFLLDNFYRMSMGRNLEARDIIKGFDSSKYFLDVDFHISSGLCANVLQAYPDSNSTLFRDWLKFSGEDGCPIAPKGVKKGNKNFGACSDYYDYASNKYKKRNGDLRLSLLVYVIQQLEWAISHRENDFNPFDCIDKGYWTNKPKQLKRMVKRWGQVDK